MTPSQTRSYFAAILAKLPTEQRAQIWCDLNRYVWPGEFESLKPDGWDTMSRYDKNQKPIYLDLWNAVINITPEKDCRRAWNKEMTDAEFEQYWQQINQR